MQDDAEDQLKKTLIINPDEYLIGFNDESGFNNVTSNWVGIYLYDTTVNNVT